MQEKVANSSTPVKLKRDTPLKDGGSGAIRIGSRTLYGCHSYLGISLQLALMGLLPFLIPTLYFFYYKVYIRVLYFFLHIF